MRKHVDLGLQLKCCEDCGAPVVPLALERIDGIWPTDYHIFSSGPSSKRDQFFASIGVKWASNISGWNRTVCAECVDSGRYTVKCALCGQMVTAAEIKEQVGDPPEYLCVRCFATVSAKVWDEKHEELLDAHRWD